MDMTLEALGCAVLLVTPALTVEVQTEFIDKEPADEGIHGQRVRYGCERSRQAR